VRKRRVAIGFDGRRRCPVLRNQGADALVEPCNRSGNAVAVVVALLAARILRDGLQLAAEIVEAMIDRR
jgi:hypothetical protein